MNTTFEVFVPGRVCLFGEHSDWAGSFRRFNATIEKGFAIVCGTNHGLYARVSRNASKLVLSSTSESGERHGPFEVPMTTDALLEVAKQGEFWSYGAGVAYKIMTDYRVGGLTIDNFRTTLPLKKGLSSSAAFCVMVARAFNRAYDLKMTVRGEMEYAYQGEIVTPSRCGRMDQACAFGSRPVCMTFDSDFVDVRPLHVPRPIHLLVVDLRAEKNTPEILSSLQGGFLRQLASGAAAQARGSGPGADDGGVADGVADLLGRVNLDITARVRAAIECGDNAALGALMTEAQARFDEYAAPACPSQLTAPVLHRVLAYGPIQHLVHGGKGVGAGGDGTAQFLCKGEAEQAEVAAVLLRDLGMPCLPLTVTASNPIRTAVIPAAGFGRGMFPATKAVPAELLPIIDEDGLATPAVLLTVRELVGAGIEKVVLVVQPEYEAAFGRLFHEPLAPQNAHRLSRAAAHCERDALDLGKRVTLVVQEKQEGFGHAVHCARAEVGEGEPFLVVLADHVFREAAGAAPCAKQVMDAYARDGKGVVGLRVASTAEAHRFGVAGAVPDAGAVPERGAGVTVTALAEKPELDADAAHLSLGGDGSACLLAFGIYAVPPAVWSVLDDVVAHNVRQLGSIQFTSALEILRAREGLRGLIVDGERFDIGTPSGYAKAVAGFAQAAAHDAATDA